MKRFLIGVLAILVLLVAAVVVFKDVLLAAVVEKAVTSLTGFPTRVGSLRLTLPSTIEIKDLSLENPPGFREKVFVSVPEIYASIVLPELARGERVHLPALRLNLKEVHIEKNEGGVSNIELLSSVGKKGTKKAPVKPPSEKPPVPFLLERFELTIRQVSYEDRSGLMGTRVLGKGVAPNRVALDLRVEREVFSNITDPRTLVSIILVKILSSSTLGRLLDIDPQRLLGENLGGVLRTGTRLADTVSQELGTTIDQAARLIDKAAIGGRTGAALDTTLDEAGNVVSQTTATAKQKISGLFGKVIPLQSSQQQAQKAE